MTAQRAISNTCGSDLVRTLDGSQLFLGELAALRDEQDEIRFRLAMNALFLYEIVSPTPSSGRNEPSRQIHGPEDNHEQLCGS